MTKFIIMCRGILSTFASAIALGGNQNAARGMETQARLQTNMVLRFAHLVWNAALRAIIDMCRAMILHIRSAPSTSGPPRAHPVRRETAPKLILTYFDAPGIAQATRNALDYGDIEFQDHRITREDFDAIKSDLPYGKVQVLTIGNDEIKIAQSKAILRYASKLSRTYSSDPVDAAIIDQWTELHTEFTSLLAINMYPDEYGLVGVYDKEEHRQYLVKTHIPRYLAILENDLDGADDENWLGGMDAMSMADIVWHQTLESMNQGTLDGFDPNMLASFPLVRKYLDEVSAQLSCKSVYADADDDGDTQTSDADGDGDSHTSDTDGTETRKMK